MLNKCTKTIYRKVGMKKKLNEFRLMFYSRKVWVVIVISIAIGIVIGWAINW